VQEFIPRCVYSNSCKKYARSYTFTLSNLEVNYVRQMFGITVVLTYGFIILLTSSMI